jgi:hypothetical protein
MATPKSLTGIHPNKDPGIVKFKLSITSWFKRDTVDGTGSEVERLPDFSPFFSLASPEPFWDIDVTGPRRRSNVVLAIAIQMA